MGSAAAAGCTCKINVHNGFLADVKSTKSIYHITTLVDQLDSDPSSTYQHSALVKPLSSLALFSPKVLKY